MTLLEQLSLASRRAERDALAGDEAAAVETVQLGRRIEHIKRLEAKHRDVVGKPYDEGWQDALEAAWEPLP